MCWDWRGIYRDKNKYHFLANIGLYLTLLVLSSQIFRLNLRLGYVSYSWTTVLMNSLLISFFSPSEVSSGQPGRFTLDNAPHLSGHIIYSLKIPMELSNNSSIIPPTLMPSHNFPKTKIIDISFTVCFHGYTSQMQPLYSEKDATQGQFLSRMQMVRIQSRHSRLCNTIAKKSSRHNYLLIPGCWIHAFSKGVSAKRFEIVSSIPFPSKQTITLMYVYSYMQLNLFRLLLLIRNNINWMKTSAFFFYKLTQIPKFLLGILKKSSFDKLLELFFVQSKSMKKEKIAA